MVNFHRDILRKINSGELLLAEDDRKAKLADGQAIGEMLLDAEARIGELSYSVPTASPIPSKKGQVPSRYDKMGLRRKQVENAQTIHRHPAAVAAVIKEARENEDIPTKTAVLNRIRYEKEKARREKAKEEPNKLVMTLEQELYITALEQVINILPQNPPKDWDEDAYRVAAGYAKIIIGRLEVFTWDETKLILPKK
jgi:hypothetical protein